MPRAGAVAPLAKEGILHETAIKNAAEYCFERRSVVRDKQVLQAALKIGRGEVDVEKLKQELDHREQKGAVIREGKELSAGIQISSTGRSFKSKSIVPMGAWL